MTKPDKTGNDQASAASDFAGHVLGYALGSDLRFELRSKKGKQRSCVVSPSHPLFDLAAETVAHAHWADRKLSVTGNSSDKGDLTVHTVQVGDAFKSDKVRPEKSKKEKAAAANGTTIPA